MESNLLNNEEINNEELCSEEINNECNCKIIKGDKFRLIGKYWISEFCLKSYPCKHYVEVKNNTLKVISSPTIFKMLRKENIYDKHFYKYEEYVRKIENPTPEEINERKLKQLQSEIYKKQHEEFMKQKEMEIQIKKEERLKKGIYHSYAERLERLKNKYLN